MESVDGRSLGLGYDLQGLAHACVLGTCSRLRLRSVRPYRGHSDYVFDGGRAQDTLWELMFEDLFGVGAERSEVISTEFLGGGSVAGWECMLVGELSAEIGHAARLGWIQVQLEPLMT